jgi:thioredoxin reductase (NADPH)
MPMLTVYGATWCPDCRRSKKFLQEQRIPFEWVDLEARPDAVAEVERRNGGKRIIPTIVFDDGSHLAEPTDEALADKLGLVRSAMHTEYDVVIVGGGPTGLTAAIYTARENLRTLVLDRSGLGGQAGVTERLDNYPGFPDGVGGAELADRFVRQAQRYGVETLPAVGVVSVTDAGDRRLVTTTTGQVYEARAVVVATGSTYRRLGVPGEAELIGAGIHFCATCDGPFYAGAPEVVVVGGGNSGLEEGLFLTQFADRVTVVEHSSSLKASRLLQDKVLAHPRMTVRTSTDTLAFVAGEDGKLDHLVLRDRVSGTTRDHPATGAFVFIGLDPNAGFLAGQVALDERGFVQTDRMMATTIPGVFAAGDVRAGSTKQLAAAAGEGAAVALQVRAFLDAMA